MKNYIWITWERQRRSVELAQAFGAELFIIEYRGWTRYIKSVFKTFSIMRKKRPGILFVQNPSLLLGFFSAVFLRFLFRTPVVVDRHSNFLLLDENLNCLKRILFDILSQISILYADITIITNEPLYHFVKISGGKPFILPDKIPEMPYNSYPEDSKSSRKELLIIASFGKDEPFDVMWQAIDKVKLSDFTVYVSGNYHKLPSRLIKEKPNNVRFTGFLPDIDFDKLLCSVDAVLVLTISDYILLRGCYEAIAAEKPLITSGTAVLKERFPQAIFVDPNPDSIAAGIAKCFFDLQAHKAATIKMKEHMGIEWMVRFKELRRGVSDLSR